MAWVKVPISKIVENPNNPRTIKTDKYQKLVKSLKEFPEMLEKRPIVVDENMIVLGGNMRLKACGDAGIVDVPVVIAEGWTDEQKREFIIKDNVGFGDWDWDIIANEWDTEELEDWGLDLPDDWGVNKEVEEDEVPEVDQGESASRLGEVYQLGRHRLMCGDSTKIEDVEKLMDGKKADMVFTDPPYGVAYVGKTKDALTIQNDALGDEGTRLLVADALRIAPIKTGAVFYVCSPAGNTETAFRLAIADAGLALKQCIVWVKDHFVMGRQDYHWRHESILYGWKEGSAHFYGGGRSQDTVWEVKRPTVSKEHPTMKPIELVLKGIGNSSKGDDIVLDLFGGSGSTLIACEQTNRICYMMELDEHYCDVTRKRYHKYVTGDEQGWQEGTPCI
jgi:DNA modification methylase